MVRLPLVRGAVAWPVVVVVLAMGPDAFVAGHAPQARPGHVELTTFPAQWTYQPGTLAAFAPHGMVASNCALATEAGVEILKAGGNAVDAAVAVGFALAGMGYTTRPGGTGSLTAIMRAKNGWHGLAAGY